MRQYSERKDPSTKGQRLWVDVLLNSITSKGDITKFLASFSAVQILAHKPLNSENLSVAKSLYCSLSINLLNIRGSGESVVECLLSPVAAVKPSHLMVPAAIASQMGRSHTHELKVLKISSPSEPSISGGRLRYAY